MQDNRNVTQRLALYGFNSKSENKKSITEKIIQMYELLQQKTTQNLLLRKDNDDIKLQILTIKDLFMNSQIDINSFEKQEVYYDQNQNFIPHNNFQNKKNFKTGKNKTTDNFQNNTYNYDQNTQSNKNQYLQNKKDQKYYQEQNNSETLSFQNKTLKTKNQQYKNHLLKNQNQFDQNLQQNTTRKISTQKNNINDSSLNDKIELLMKQNQIILKRMNQIQVNLIKGQKQNNYQKYKKRNLEDKQTNFSSNITSIHNIGQIRQPKLQAKSQFRHQRNHHSTNNLRTYSMAFER